MPSRPPFPIGRHQTATNIERMLKAVVSKKGAVHACGTCAEARGLQELKLVEGVEVGTVSGLAQSVVEADKVLTF